MLNIRQDFPYLERTVNDNPIIYLDNAATTQKPRQVMSRILDLYASGTSNVHRAVNFLADEVTQAFEASRETVARFIGAQAREIVFVSNASHGLNIVCAALSSKRPPRVLTTTLEHHSNLLPWANHGEVDFLPWQPDGTIELDALASRLKAKPDLVTVARASNFLGTLQPIREIVAMCRDAGVPVLVDASQSIAHESHDVRELGCDFLVFSGHKIYGPSGTGVLYVRHDVIETMQPVFLGGGMVKEVHDRTFEANDIPYRFEVGTPNIEGIIGLGEALQYVSTLGYDAIMEHENALVQYAKRQLDQVPTLQMYGPPLGATCAPLISFQIKGMEPSGVAKLLGNRANIIVRSGFHCAQPAHDHLGIGPTVRASFGIYNTEEEINRMVEVLQAITRLLD